VATYRPPAGTGKTAPIQLMPSLKHPLTPFVDKLPIPPRLVFSEPGRAVVRLETAEHRFHRDLPPSRVWTYDGSVPGTTIEISRGVELEVRWENHLTGPLPVVVTVASEHAVDGIPAQCVPGPVRWRARHGSRRAFRLFGCPPPRRHDAGHQRRLDGEHRRSRSGCA